MVISSRKFENFELFCPLGAMRLGVQQSYFWLKFDIVTTICEALMLLNFCGNRGRGLGAGTKTSWRFKLKKTFGKQSFRYLSKIKFGQKNFSPKPPLSTKNPKKND